MTEVPLSEKFGEARLIGKIEFLSGSFLAMLGFLLIFIGDQLQHPSAGAGGNVVAASPFYQSLQPIGLIALPLGAGLLVVGWSKRRDALRRVIYVEAPMSGLRPETLSYIQSESRLGSGDLMVPRPASLSKKEEDIISRMDGLKALLDKGLISQEDFEIKKKDLLSKL